MGLKKSVIAECVTFRNTVFGSAEIEDVSISDKAPVFQSRNFETEVSTILIAEA